MKQFLLACVLLCTATVSAQSDTNRIDEGIITQDRIAPMKVLDVVVVINTTPYGFPSLASKFTLDPKLLDGIGRTPVNVLNTVPGVRMEERSPGSYRLSMRGSAIRSPYGTRNTAIYYNDVPLTDAGGNAYLNLIDFGQVEALDVFKGPGPAGFGSQSNGTLILSSTSRFMRNKFSLSSSAGSFGYQHHQLDFARNLGKHYLTVKGSYQYAKGYRDQSGMQRMNLLVSDHFRINYNSSLDLFVLAAHLDYETPGGLTAEQFLADPTQARPATAFSPGSAEQDAGISNNTGLFGMTHHLQFKRFRFRNSVFGSVTRFDNPFITNYEKHAESNGGIRSVGNLRFGKYTDRFQNASEVAVGVEARLHRSFISNADNLQGQEGNLQSSDLIYALNVFAFSSIKYNIRRNLTFEASVNAPFNKIYFKHKFPVYEPEFQTFNPAPGSIYPSASLSWSRGSFILTGLYSSGYSNPSVQEIRPATQVVNTALRAESTQNLELNVKWIRYRKLTLQANVYTSVVDQAIIRRTDAAGNDYYQNAGSILQNGIELAATYYPFRVKYADGGFPVSLMLSQNYTYYRFRDYISEAGVFNGNVLTGTPQYTGSFEMLWRPYEKLEVDVNYQYVSSIFLDDANTLEADPAHILRASIRYRFTRRRDWTLFATGDNLLNQRYSLGNDLNAYGGRYFNPAPALNFRVGLKVDFMR